jgi:predicted ATPase
MAIKRIKISNFKNFKSLDISISDFNVLIGANASGKSNFIQLFRFLRDINNHGLDNAVSMQGGVEYLRNIAIGSSENLIIEVLFDHNDKKYVGIAFGKESGVIYGLKPNEIEYKFVMRWRRRRFEISEEKYHLKFQLFRLHMRKPGKEESLGAGEITFAKAGKKIDVDLKPEDLPMKKDEILSLAPFGKTDGLLIESPSNYTTPLEDMVNNIALYDFDPKLPKKAAPITGKAELEEDGSNLSLVLKNLLESREKNRKFSNLLKDLLPFVDKIDTEKFADKSLLFKLRETYAKSHYLPASLISDGTINITALIIALYFEGKRFAVIEEPERNIHPYLISKIIEMMKDASSRKQIIVTTHNPEIVKYAGLGNILIVSRDKSGFSNIHRPDEKDEVKTFLENEMGIEELYVQNLLEP